MHALIPVGLALVLAFFGYARARQDGDVWRSECITLTMAVCVVLGGIVTPAHAAQAPMTSAAAGSPDSATYRDPHGRYSFTVPAGWSAATDASGNTQLASGPSWATLAATGGSQPVDVNHQILQQIQAQYKEFRVLNEGDLQVNGHPAHGSNATGINPKGVRVSMLVIAISAGSAHFLVVISSAPNDQARDVNNTIMQMTQTIRFAGE